MLYNDFCRPLSRCNLVTDADSFTVKMGFSDSYYPTLAFLLRLYCDYVVALVPF